MKSNKLKKICVIATTTLVLCGCADQEITEAVPDSQSADTATQEISNVADEADTVEENTAIEASTQTSQDTADNASEQDKIVVERTGDIPEEYEDFVSGVASAYFADPDQYRICDLPDEINLNEEYTIAKLEKSIIESFPSYDDSEPSTVSAWAIDCGKDGEQELEVKIEYPGAPYDDYLVRMIVKKIDDTYEIRYFSEATLRSGESIDASGNISPSGAASYDVYGGDYGFLDAEVKWHFSYYYNYYLDMDAYSNHLRNMGIEIDFSGEEWYEFQVEEYSFDEDYSNRTYYTVYIDLDENGQPKDMSIYEDGSVYKKTFEEAGITTYTPDEMEKILEEKQ
ncbi:MAG: hypothetical protein E7309_15705 [Butyrivibrio sp.]|nr:hypothetical protein [Butyrivibrio sp.]